MEDYLVIYDRKDDVRYFEGMKQSLRFKDIYQPVSNFNMIVLMCH